MLAGKQDEVQGGGERVSAAWPPRPFADFTQRFAS